MTTRYRKTPMWWLAGTLLVLGGGCTMLDHTLDLFPYTCWEDRYADEVASRVYFPCDVKPLDVDPSATDNPQKPL